MQKTIELLQRHNELKIIDTPLDTALEIPHAAYIEVKKEDSKALLFTRPKRGEKIFQTPVLMNLFGSFSRLELLLGNPENIAQEIESLIKIAPPSSASEALHRIRQLFSLRFLLPQKTKTAPCQEVVTRGEAVNLFDLPILKTWEKDGGAFITCGQVYTRSLDGKHRNLGLYRLQVYGKNRLGLHWQIHKDAMRFFSEYKKAGRRMPVSIGIGGDPLYTWCAQAPLPFGMDELLLYGLIKKQRVKLVKCLTNELSVPYDCDFVIEGFAAPEVLENEGPFGDHTGFYTPIEPYPVLEVSAITAKVRPIYLATVVGKPPLEDKFLGYATERIFLPLLKAANPALLDYSMPENGVFHNLILAKIAPEYPEHSKQIMHSFWGTGQMSFVKHAIFVPPSAPSLDAHEKIAEFILNSLDFEALFVSYGVCDALDHASPSFASGAKLGIDCTANPSSKHSPNCSPKPTLGAGDFAEDSGRDSPKDSLEILSDRDLLAKIAPKYPEITQLRQFFTHTKNPITIVLVEKKSRVLEHLAAFEARHCRLVFVLDAANNELESPYMLLWRVANNIDAKRDIALKSGVALIDATAKGAMDGHSRAWPEDVLCSRAVLERLVGLGVIKRDEALWRRFGIL